MPGAIYDQAKGHSFKTRDMATPMPWIEAVSNTGKPRQAQTSPALFGSQIMH